MLASLGIYIQFFHGLYTVSGEGLFDTVEIALIAAMDSLIEREKNDRSQT